MTDPFQNNEEHVPLIVLVRPHLSEQLRNHDCQFAHIYEVAIKILPFHESHLSASDWPEHVYNKSCNTFGKG